MKKNNLMIAAGIMSAIAANAAKPTLEVSLYAAGSNMQEVKSTPRVKPYRRKGALCWRIPVSDKWRKFSFSFKPTGVQRSNMSFYLKSRTPLLFDDFKTKNCVITDPSFEKYVTLIINKKKYYKARGVWSSIKHQVIVDPSIAVDGKACVYSPGPKCAFTLNKLNLSGIITVSFQVKTAGTIKPKDIPKVKQFKRVPHTPSRKAWTPKILKSGRLQDFSYAGCGKIPDVPVVVKAADFGAIPNDGKDDVAAIQKAIDAAAKKGGGAVLLGKGRFDFNVDSKSLTHLEIPYSNIVLRGSGSSKDGTVFYLNYKMLYPKGWGGPAMVYFSHPQKIETWVNITAPAKVGDTEVRVSSTTNLNPGDMIRIYMFNPPKGGGKTPLKPELFKNRDNALSRDLISPLKPAPEWKNFAKWSPFQWLVRIKSKTADTLKFEQPLRVALNMKYGPKLCRWKMGKNCGIENIRFDSSWRGPYRHHLNRDADYAWFAIGMTNLNNSWVRNLSINNFTIDVRLRNCKNITIRNIIVNGQAGHHGLGATGFDNLLENAVYNCERTHLCGSSSNSSGNVFRNITATKPKTYIDLHGGGFARYNLFENIKGARVAGAGSDVNMPHTGHGNVFWNIECGPQHRAPSDLFDGLWNYMAYQSRRGGSKATDNHKLYPKSIVVGVYHPEEKVFVDKSEKNRDDKWIYIEGMNKAGIQPASLYEYQVKNKQRVMQNTVSALPTSVPPLDRVRQGAGAK
jgi:Domain of unknown function (DUF4955)